MKIFNLPDLGEGLPEAEIREWFIAVGDNVKTDQPIAAVETAKALVDIPAPFDGQIERLFGEPGDTIKTGKPLIAFKGESTHEEKAEPASTVVGEIPASNVVVETQPLHDSTQQPTASPKVRALARKLKVDLSRINSSSDRITTNDVLAAAQAASHDLSTLPATRKAMAETLSAAHQAVAAITVTEEANISHWFKQEDITLRAIEAMIYAIKKEPMLNSHFDFDNSAFQQHDHINIGLAVDTEHGLYVPVIQHADQLDKKALREKIEQYKSQAQSKSIQQADLKNASIVLSNFGAFAGRFGTPLVTPPTVCIVGIGQAYEAALSIQGSIQSGHLLPISISIDHRLITGGEATRFLRAFKQHCENKTD